MFKLYAKRVLDGRIKRLKTSSKMIVQLTETTLQELEVYNTHPSPENLNKVKMQERVVSQLHIEKAKQGLFFCKTRIYEHGERAGKLLAYLAHLEDKPPIMVSLIGPDGTLITDPTLVAKLLWRTLSFTKYIHALRNLSIPTYNTISTYKSRTISGSRGPT